MRKFNINKEKMTKENVYKFLKDNTNKGLIINLLCLFILIIVLWLVPNIWLKFLIYYLLWFIILKTYDKVVDLLFRRHCK